MSSRHPLLSSASFAVLALWLAQPASASGPAVSGPNGKISAFTGTIDGDFTLGSTGSFAVPLSGAWGAQVDVLVGTAEGGGYYGIGGHLFTRDPAKGLIGFYGSYVGWGSATTVPVDTPEFGVADITGANVGKLGVEGEAYLGRFSLEGLAAWQFGTNSGLAGKAMVAFYPSDNLRLDLGYNYLQGPGSSITGGIEWAPNGNAGLFVSAAAAQSGNTTVIGGIKAYFGGSPTKSLIRREREDDPENLLPEDLYTTLGSGYCPDGRFLDDDRCDGSG